MQILCNSHFLIETISLGTGDLSFARKMWRQLLPLGGGGGGSIKMLIEYVMKYSTWDLVSAACICFIEFFVFNYDSFPDLLFCFSGRGLLLIKFTYRDDSFFFQISDLLTLNGESSSDPSLSSEPATSSSNVLAPPPVPPRTAAKQDNDANLIE